MARKPQYIEKGHPLEKLPLNTIVGYCPDCGRPLAIRNGKYGRYIYCKNIDCHRTIQLKNYKLDDEMAISLINLKTAENWNDYEKATHILMTCPQDVRKEAEWTVDKIYRKLMEETE